MQPTLTRLAHVLRHPLAGWFACAAAVLAIAAWLGGGARPPPQTAAPARRSVAVPMQGAGLAVGAEARQLVVTVRWGHPAGRIAQAGQAGWDGYVSLDCGDILGVEPQAWEANAGDHVGPVVRGDAGDQRVYWRSSTAADWDGLKLRLQTCPSGADGDESHLRIVTPARTYVARLAWSLDDFVSLPTGLDGSSLDVHIAADTDVPSVRRDRVSHVVPLEPLLPMAAVPSSESDAAPAR